MKFLLTLLAILTLSGGNAFAQEYPDKAVRLITPYGPGGSTGVVARAISQKFQEFTGQPMVVDHRPGGGQQYRQRHGREGSARRLHAAAGC